MTININNSCCPVAKTLKDINGNGDMIYRTEIIPLDVAREAAPNNPPFILAGNRLLVEIATGSASIVFNERDNAQIPLLAGLQIKGAFDRFWIVNEAQANAELTIIVSTNLEASLSIPPEPKFATVTYEPNGGTENSFSDFARLGRPYALASGGFTQAGKTLSGWNTEAFSAMSGWVTSNLDPATPSSNDFYGVVAANDGTLIITGLNGKIYTSNDDGATWVSRYSDNPTWTMMRAFNANGTIIVPTFNRSILKSNDNGVTWTLSQIYAGSSSLYGGISIGNIIILYGEGGVTIRSADNGNTWSFITMSGSPEIRCMENFNTGIIAATSTGIFISQDTGITWQQTYIDSGYSSHLCRVNDSLILAAGSSGLSKSIDGGFNWAPLASPIASPILRIFKINNMLIAVCNDGSIYQSLDNAQSWTGQPSIQQIFITGGSLINNKIILASHGGYINISTMIGTLHPLGQPFNPYLLGDQTLFAAWS